jgi:hypothetical protein
MTLDWYQKVDVLQGKMGWNHKISNKYIAYILLNKIKLKNKILAFKNKTYFLREKFLALKRQYPNLVENGQNWVFLRNVWILTHFSKNWNKWKNSKTFVFVKKNSKELKKIVTGFRIFRTIRKLTKNRRSFEISMSSGRLNWKENK